MAPIAARGKYIALASDESVLFIDTQNGVHQNVSIPPIEDAKQQTAVKITTKYEDISHINMGTCIAFSDCGTYLAVCTTNKNLSVWKTSSQELLKQWLAPRKVSSLTFTKKNQLIVADKAGDCYEFTFFNEPLEKGKLILGHLSMLLDVTVTEDEKFIITCERDEKIRISCFPNAYNIHAFCLGHTEFVSSLNLIAPQLLLSASGDATLRVWDVGTGKQLHLEKLRSDEDKEMDKAVRSVFVHSPSDGCRTAAVLMNKCKEILICNIDLEGLKFKNQILAMDCTPLSATFTEEGNLHVLTDDKSCPIRTFQLDSNSAYVPFIHPLIKQLIDNEAILKLLQDCSSSCDGDLKPLYKRWFDNVQQYQQRKADRIENQSSDSVKRVRVE